MTRLFGNLLGAAFAGVVSLGFVTQGLLTLGVVALVFGGFLGLL